MFFIFVIGTAGGGKSTLVDAFSSWLEDHELEVATLNLDPAAAWLPYSPDVDVRKYVSFEEVMRKYGLGPNGALIACTDMMATYVEKLKEDLSDINPKYVLVDTSGQMELYAFRSSGPYITANLATGRSAVLFLIDAVLAERPSGLLSSLLLATSVTYRLRKPQINVISKADLLDPDSLERVLSWVEEPIELMEALNSELKGLDREVNLKLCEALKDLGLMARFIPTSSKKWQGLDELFAELQRILAGGGEEFVITRE